jgi:hypothetical protein
MDEVKIKCRDRNAIQLFVYLRAYSTTDPKASYKASSSKERNTHKDKTSQILSFGQQ